MAICIIPARKGSKRIPNKNFREFAGDPIIWYAISTAVGIDDIEGITVSTDEDFDPDWGDVEVCDRPTHLCDDHTGLRDVMAWHLSDNDDDDICVCLLPCTPLLREETLRNAIRAYRDFHAEHHRMLASVVEYAHPISRSMSLKDGGLTMSMGGVTANFRTQDCDSYFHDAGQFYIATAKRWREDRAILDRARPWFLGRSEAIDIDTEDDWKLAEEIYKGRYLCE